MNGQELLMHTFGIEINSRNQRKSVYRSGMNIKSPNGITLKTILNYNTRYLKSK